MGADNTFGETNFNPTTIQKNKDMEKIKVLKDTPFHDAGEIISINEFRNAYSYIMARTVSDFELIRYLRRERMLVLEKPSVPGNHTGCWFEVIEEFKLYDCKIKPGNVRITFTNGQVEARTIEEAKKQVIEKLKFNLNECNEALDNYYNTAGFKIEMNFDEVEVMLSE